MVTAAHPVIPLDVVEATWLVKLPGRGTDGRGSGWLSGSSAGQARRAD